MSSKKSPKKIVRPNPLVGMVISKEEFQDLFNLSLITGVSVAQIARGYMRIGRESAKRHKKFIDIARLGAL